MFGGLEAIWYCGIGHFGGCCAAALSIEVKKVMSGDHEGISIQSKPIVFKMQFLGLILPCLLF